MQLSRLEISLCMQCHENCYRLSSENHP
uniref:Uncharacterized protein n=1 Tax=Rhizophora mucronata TaxID=61149 RepID=A0A2P2IP60_RHIMU